MSDRSVNQYILQNQNVSQNHTSLDKKDSMNEGGQLFYKVM